MLTAKFKAQIALVGATCLGTFSAFVLFARPPIGDGASGDTRELAPRVGAASPAALVAASAPSDRGRAVQALLSRSFAPAPPPAPAEPRAFADWSEEELLAEVRKIDAEIEGRDWVERANRDDLSAGERADLSALLRRRDALSVERAQRLLDALDRDETR